MIRTLKNISGSSLVLTDFRGTAIDTDETIDGLQFGETALRESASVLQHCIAGELEVGDGQLTYTGTSAVALIMGFAEQLTKDGKRIFTPSDRPKDHFRYYSSQGDDLQNQIRGQGDSLLFQLQPNETVSKDIKFIDDVYVRDGAMDYVDAEYGSWMSAQIMAPAGVPYPVFNKTGTLDYNGSAFVPNANGTGDYKINMTEDVAFNTFVNHMLFMQPNGEKTINSPEPVLMYKPYYLRFTVHNASAVKTLSIGITMGLYRKYTI